jgi:hypothetical protein
LAAVKDFKAKRQTLSIGDALDAEFDHVRLLRGKFLTTLQQAVGSALLEFTPTPSSETASGIVAFGIEGGDEQHYELARRRLELQGILVDIIGSQGAGGIRVCIPTELDIAEVERVASAIAEALYFEPDDVVGAI